MKGRQDTAPKAYAPCSPMGTRAFAASNNQPTRPPISKKPVQFVKPRVQSEKIYWNGSKEEGTRSAILYT